MTNPVHVTDTNFDAEVLKNDLIVITDFWAEWCVPCRVIAPMLDEIASEYEGKVKIAKLNIDQNPNITSQYNVLSIPTLLFFKNGQIIGQLVGAVSKKKIVETFTPYLVNNS